MHVVEESKGYDSAKRFFGALREQGTPVEFHTKLNRETLAQIIHQISR